MDSFKYSFPLLPLEERIEEQLRRLNKNIEKTLYIDKIYKKALKKKRKTITLYNRFGVSYDI